MAGSDYVVRLTGNSKGLNDAVKSAQDALNDLGKQNQSLGKINERFGKIANSAAPLRKKIADIKKAMEDLAVSGNNVGAEGEAMWKKMAQAAKAYQDQLDDVGRAVKNGGKGLDIGAIVGDVADKFGLGGLSGQLAGIASMANPATMAVTAVAGTMAMAGKAAADFETHLDDLQALTGLTDKAMKGVSDTALEMSKKFGTGAGEIADAMGLIGSQQPELLKDADALAYVTDAAMTLAKAGSIGAEEAGKAISTVVNQMDVLPSEAMNIANALEAAEQQGSASVAYLNTAFEKAGTQAKMAGMGYTELAAMIETVAPKFSSADVAGSQLNSTLLKLSMGADEFNPAVVGMSQALQNMADAQLSNEQLTKMVGEANVTMIKTMVDGRAAFEGFSTSLTGTNAAVDSFQTKTGNFAGAIDRLKATWDAFLITLGQSGIIDGIADNLMMVMQALGEVVDVIGEVINAFGAFGTVTDRDVNPLKTELDVLVGIIRGVGIALQMVVKNVAKLFNAINDSATQTAEWIGEKWTALKDVLGDTAFGKVVINAFNAILDACAKMCNKVKEYWNRLMDYLGIDSGKFKVEVAPKLDADVKHTQASNTVKAVQGGTVTAAEPSSTPKAAGIEVKPKFEEGSIKALEAEITALNAELNNTVVSDGRLKAILAEKAEIEEQVKALKVRNGLMKEDKKEVKKPEKTELEQNRDTYNEAGKKVSQAKSDFEIGLIDKGQAQTAIDEANAMLQGIGLEPLDLHVNDDGTITDSLDELEEYKEKMSEMSGQIGEIGGAFGSMGEAIGGTGGKMMAFAGQTMQAAAQIIPKIVSMIAAKQAEATASGIASGAALPFPANLAAMASIIATVVSLFASIPKTFAEGGIVPGNSIHGDRVLARVNSGEMILNQRQQSNLYRTLKNGDVGKGGLAGNVQFVIEGTQLKGCLNNYDKKMTKLR